MIRVVNDSTESVALAVKGMGLTTSVYFSVQNYSRKFDNVEFIVNDSVKEGDIWQRCTAVCQSQPDCCGKPGTGVYEGTVSCSSAKVHN